MSRWIWPIMVVMALSCGACGSGAMQNFELADVENILEASQTAISTVEPLIPGDFEGREALFTGIDSALSIGQSIIASANPDGSWKWGTIVLSCVTGIVRVLKDLHIEIPGIIGDVVRMLTNVL